MSSIQRWLKNTVGPRPTHDSVHVLFNKSHLEYNHRDYGNITAYFPF